MIARVSTRWLLTVWGALVIATLISAALGAEEGASSVGVRTGTVIALAVAFVKAHLIGMQFMELRHAGDGLSRLFTVWVLVVAITIIGLYLKG
ncbi:cytochrome C oxidase subunit IV family protein [Mycolicibacterium sp. lyk4-40-TYG-92]|jgi:heme/copper-type cytochrome/quinol oxidase subunit 4|uniref:cytochrome C oxidase subunit IV family protein n=1 Tax=Mycolicibacterium sp. lyk4-40-TYG-92 TaxID=3040295 RepID=UPI00254A41BA|nr:cytochrome C oxidase subunit IV family protein [Mycolicibacterium sp. lyk4-40-TYG-92]